MMEVEKQEDFLLIMKEHAPLIKNRWFYHGIAIGFFMCLILGIVSLILLVDFEYLLCVLLVGLIMFSIISIYYYRRLVKEADQFTEYEE